MVLSTNEYLFFRSLFENQQQFFIFQQRTINEPKAHLKWSFYSCRSPEMDIFVFRVVRHCITVGFSSETQVLWSNTQKGGTSMSAPCRPAPPQVRIKVSQFVHRVGAA